MTGIDGGLRSLFQENIHAHWTVVETGYTHLGVPDLEGCHIGVSIWVELKVIRGTKIKFRPGQPAWHTSRARAGGRSFIAARKKTQTVDELWIFPGHMARRLATTGINSDYDEVVWSGGPSKWNWDEIGKVLFQ